MSTDEDGRTVAICENCRKVVVRLYLPGVNLPWLHEGYSSIYCGSPAPVATPAPSINLDEARALKAYVAANPGC